MTPLDFIKALEKFAGITYAQVKELCDTYPEIDRELRFCQNVYRNMYGRNARIEAIHAGLECGILSGKLPHLDMVSFGPDMKDIHTTGESLNIESTKRVYDFIHNIIESIVR